MATAQKPTSDSTAVAKKEKSFVVRMLERDGAQDALRPYLPKGVDIERVIASAQIAALKDPKLNECTPESLLIGVARILAWGLELGVTAHLVPFGKEATPIAGYQGLIELMIGCGAIRHIYPPQVVREGDFFDYERGMDEYLRHKPQAIVKPGTKITHVYVILLLQGGRKTFEVMTLEEVDAIRLQYSRQWKNGPCPAWYLRKTIIRQLAKYIAKNPKLASVLMVIEQDKAAEFGETPMLARVQDDDEVTPPAMCCSCESVAVDGDGEQCAGCAAESDRVAADMAHESAEAGDPTPPPENELALLDVQPRRNATTNRRA